ncbi:hypothetical protein PhaeoP24_04217 (plasmid) [Phaeobacter inhibens]|uniref:hypothetical protein n=1 Tax=Phaeobacter inhibens TaxID=221822 RepID=UPI000C9AF37D|nr:hypothetical protein [Phaeobacter inhibens]AUQ92775.1 hypothetical protein PhaeoP24_04217 [Phaeobacter inhibens]
MTLISQIRPDNARKIAMKSGGATFYLYENAKGNPCVRYYKGKSTKAKCYSFRSVEFRENYVTNIIANITAAEEDKAKRRADRNKPHNLEKGLILYTSWGYDQTNVEYYEVIGVPSKCYVDLQRIAAPLARGEEGFMSGNSVPNPENKIGETFRRKVDMSGSRPSIRIDSVATAWIWDGKEKYSSWYA